MSTAAKSKTAPSLQGLIQSAKNATVKRQVWVEFSQGIKFLVSYLPKGKLKSLMEKSTTVGFDSKSHQRVNKINPERLNANFVQECVHDWEGITSRSLATLLPVDISQVAEDQLDDPLKFEADAMVTLMTECYDVDTFLNEAVTNLTTFNASIEDELKNSKSSPDGN